MKKETYTKYQLECKLREIEDLHKTEIEQLENDNKHLKGAVTSLSERLETVTKERDHLKDEVKVLEKEHDIQVESYHKVTAENDELRKDLRAKEESNKKLADQFYEYRDELVKWRKKAADLNTKCCGLTHELEGVRGALKRQSEFREKAEAGRDEYKQEMVKWKNEASDWHNKHDGIDHELRGIREALSREAEMRVNAENKAKEMEHLADDLEKQRRELEHNREDVESLKASLADCCSAKIKEGRDLTSKIKSLKEDLKKMTGSRDWYVKEAAKLRGWYDDLKKLYDKARKEGEEGCTMWREDSWKNRDERDHYKKIYEAAARKNDELQCEVNKLTQDNTALHDRVNILEQRWTGTFNPEDELLGRKMLEWQDINVILAKHNIENSMVLGAELDMLKDYRGVIIKYNIPGAKALDESLKRLERFQQMLRDWNFQMIDEFSTYVNGLHNYKIICEQNLISSTDELKKSLDELKTFRLSPFRSLGTEWRDVVDKHHVVNYCDLENRLSLLEKYQGAAYDLQKSDGFKWLSETVSGRRE